MQYLQSISDLTATAVRNAPTEIAAEPESYPHLIRRATPSATLLDRNRVRR
jgi:hypothetical protein